MRPSVSSLNWAEPMLVGPGPTTFWGGIRKFAERFINVVDFTRFTVYGAPNDEVKGVLSGFGATFMGQLNGFAR